ncbi:phosphatidic acid phosphatase type 2/haloperoxidase [Panaeolus papilionaceus]|nr:phosphatidic acid phosphatase type 2/haloperoxidase [Panaeolus papilionaceus]
MRGSIISLSLVAAIGGAWGAVYPGDVVQYWNDKFISALNTSNPLFGDFHESYPGAYVHTAVLVAAEDAQRQSRVIQQLSVSYAAHDSITRIFLNQYQRLDAFLKAIEDIIQPTALESTQARRIGEAAAARVARARADDQISKYFRYDFQTPVPGVYQPTPPNNPVPEAQHGRFVMPWGGIKDRPKWGPPPAVNGDAYEGHLRLVKEKGAKTNHTRTADETHIGYFWLESSITFWNRFASSAIGSTLQNNVLQSAQFYAKLNWAIANAGIVGFTAKNQYNSWRPITAIRWPGVFLKSGNSLSDPNWEPVVPTPGHQDYLSGHAVYGSAGGGIIRRHLRSDNFSQPITISSLVTADNVGELTRTFTSVSQAVKENGDSRVFAGAHFDFASTEGNKAGDAAANQVWRRNGRNYL